MDDRSALACSRSLLLDSTTSAREPSTSSGSNYHEPFVVLESLVLLQVVVCAIDPSRA